MRLCDVEAALREIVAGLEPESLAADAAVGLVDTFATIEKLGAAGKALAARRVADSNLWRGAGERSGRPLAGATQRGVHRQRDVDARDRGASPGAARRGSRAARGGVIGSAG